MHYFLYLELPGFYVRVWEQSDPLWMEKPLVVHREKRVLDLNARAYERGVRLGMGVDETKVLLHGAGLIAYEEEPYRLAQARWLDALAEFSSCVEPRDPHSAWADLSGHPEPYEIVSLIRSQIACVSGLRLQVGMARSKWLSRLTCDLVGDADPLLWEDAVREALISPALFLKDLPVGLLSPVAPAYLERLKFLGYRKIGDVASIPLKTLRGQFGNDAQRIYSSARGGFQEAVRPLYPPDAIVAKIAFEGGVSNSEELSLGLQKLARKLTKLLSDRESCCSRIELKIVLEDSVVECSRTFSKPMRTAREVFSALTRLIQLPSESIFSVVAKMPNLKKALERQSGLFTAQHSGDDLEVGRAIEQVRQVYGDKSVFRASEVVEPRRVKVLRAWSHATGWK